MNVLLFFTFGVSLEDWKDKGFLDREIKYYNKLYEKNIKFTFITYGDGSDLELINKIDSKIEIIPIFKNFKVKNKSHFKNSNLYYKNAFSLPIYPDLKIKSVYKVIHEIKKLIKN